MENSWKLIEKIPEVSEYQKIRTSVGWSKVSDEAVKVSLKNSLYIICVYREKELVGLGRVIGDKGIYYYIQDVMVLPRYQRQGIGRAIMGRIMEFLDENSDSTAFFGLMAAKGYYSFYETYGFRKRDEEAPGMFRYH
ncbi:MAG: GNAT family N-acetyltransferase [Candidatus Hodarchaeales archaeon]